MVPAIPGIARSGLRAGAAGSKEALFARARAALAPSRSAEAAAFFVPGRIEVLGKHTDYAGGRSLLCAVEQGLDPKRTVAVDTLFPMVKRRTIMGTPVTDPAFRDAAHGLLASEGVPVTVCHDSPGFIAQRIVAMIVNIGCSIAQSRTAAPADIDMAVTLGLNYPNGPFRFADTLGVERIHRVLASMYRIYGDPRYRPNIWLARRAKLGVSALTPEN